MENKKVQYNIINIIVIVLAFLFLGNLMLKNKDIISSFSTINTKIEIVIVGSITFCVIHILKMLRFYLILLEEKLELKRFIRIYIKTAFVNITLPVKSGELFRFYCYSNETNNYKIGLLSILVERFFDTCALLLFLLPFEMFFRNKLSYITLSLLVFVIIVFIIYNVFNPIYEYVNRFFILNINSKKSLKVLEILENQNEWYLYTKKLIKGRFSLIFFLSFLAWTLEYFFVYFISKALELQFTLDTFNTYINSVFRGIVDKVLGIYTVLGAIVFGITMLGVYAISFKKRGNSSVK
ncbi:lysylphosphatidylglycerol synthase domain-containing protein [Clostridium beijerinckii]|uniref:lysylphosphatidylglycerol synthase domain-containing protein n=1 Tax=Clostridium beijerinckii TaxID=1520 RepID=UPI001F44AA54|nr:lysylphosphatidylglycerol synthase domain-containing protein [Clostridium beijerinckii]